MSINKIYTVYFSPTGGTEKIAAALADSISSILHIPTENIDLTVPANRQKHYDFNFSDIIAKDRPDASDLALLSDFAAKTAEKLSSDRKLTAIEYDIDIP